MLNNLSWDQLSHDHQYGDMFIFSVATAVHGFNGYQDIWEPTIGEVLAIVKDQRTTIYLQLLIAVREKQL